MKPKSFMVIAGEASGDLLAGELVRELRQAQAAAAPVITNDYQPLETSLEPRFFGAGGKRMAEAGVELAFDLTAHSVTGLSDVLKKYFEFRRLFKKLYRLALDRQPDAIICVDFSGFNRRFAHAIKRYVRSHHDDWFHVWNPKLVQYVSPQVWASREGRAQQMAQDYDLVLSIFPFEKEWYAQRVPRLRVEFVGHPLVDRYGSSASTSSLPTPGPQNPQPRLLLLPGSRPGELRRHVPVMLQALETMRGAVPGLQARMVLPDDDLAAVVKQIGVSAHLSLQAGGLAEALTTAEVAIASTGTVTMECAWFGVPTVALYKTSWSTYQIGKRVVKVKYLAMPNLLANEEVYPEFIQERATAENIATAALELLRNQEKRTQIKATLAKIVSTLGPPGASRRAAEYIMALLRPE